MVDVKTIDYNTQMTPAEIEQRKRLSQALMAAGSRQRQIRHPMQALPAFGQQLAGALVGMQARGAEKKRNQSLRDTLAQMQRPEAFSEPAWDGLSQTDPQRAHDLALQWQAQQWQAQQDAQAAAHQRQQEIADRNAGWAREDAVSARDRGWAVEDRVAGHAREDAVSERDRGWDVEDANRERGWNVADAERDNMWERQADERDHQQSIAKHDHEVANPKPTTGMQDYQHGVDNPDYRQYQLDMKQAGRSQTTVNNNMGADGPAVPEYPDLDKGYVYRRNPDGSVLLNEQGVPEVLPIVGAPSDREIQGEADAKEARESAKQEQSSLIIEEIDRALDVMNTGWLPDTGIGAVLSGVPGTDAKDLAALLDTVKANIGFEQLNQMRQQSPTGGALGQVTERELAFLQAVEGSLDQGQSKEQLVYNLNRIRGIMEKAAAYPNASEFGFGGGAGLPEGVSEEDVQHTMQLHGLTREQVLERLK